MKQLIEAHCKGTFRSYKTFRTLGQVVLHTVQNFQEWNFDDNHFLTIAQYLHPRKKLICETDQWTLEFQNKQYYIQIAQPAIRYEVISVNHTGMVLADNTRGEKIFFARLPIWESLIKQPLSLFFNKDFFAA